MGPAKGKAYTALRSLKVPATFASSVHVHVHFMCVCTSGYPCVSFCYCSRMLTLCLLDLACGFMIFLDYTTHDEQPIARRRRHSSSSPPAAAPAGVAAAAAAATAATVKQPHQQLKQL